MMMEGRKDGRTDGRREGRKLASRLEGDAAVDSLVVASASLAGDAAVPMPTAFSGALTWR